MREANEGWSFGGCMPERTAHAGGVLKYGLFNGDCDGY